MSEKRDQRRLAAILAADVVGYSRLMEADEGGTLKRLKAARKEIVDPAIAEHGGRVVKTTGDGALVEFPSAVDAVQCAIAIQEAMADLDPDLPVDQQLRFRIGINLGDIIFDDEDIYGDGVNVAARLEALAEPGGVAISGIVAEGVANKLDIVFEDGGAQQLKNIARPVHVWHWHVRRSGAPDRRGDGNEASDLPDTPSIAVLPFDNLSPESEQEFFADGLSEDIITALSKVRGLFVIARNSTFVYKGRATDIRDVASDLGVRYVLEGSVRKSGERLRVTAQLIDAATRNHVWAERYDRPAFDIFDVQDEITKEIVIALRGELTDGETALMVGGGTNDITAWGYGVRAIRLFDRWTPAQNQESRGLALKALEIDPNYAFAWILLAISYWYESRTLPVAEATELIEKTREAFDRALALDPSHPQAIGGKALSMLPLGLYDEAVTMAQKGVQLNPGSAEARAMQGFALAGAGRAAEAVTAFEDALRMNPHPPIWYWPVFARALDGVGQPERANEALLRAIVMDEENFPAHLHIASLAARMGEADRARSAAEFVLRTMPGFNLTAARAWLLTRPGRFVDEFVDGLRRAGVPDTEQ